ncbi:YwqH-like family protein [Virgibacillus kimchii]
MSANLGLLRSRRSSVLNGMSNSKQQISALSDKITRLQTASSNLQSSISVLETSNSNIDNLSIDNNRWKGTKENRFTDRYSSYQDSVRNYVQKVNDAKDGIDEEIRRAEQTKAGYTTGLNNLQSTLDSLDYQIRMAERG